MRSSQLGARAPNRHLADSDTNGIDLVGEWRIVMQLSEHLLLLLGLCRSRQFGEMNDRTCMTIPSTRLLANQATCSRFGNPALPAPGASLRDAAQRCTRIALVLSRNKSGSHGFSPTNPRALHWWHLHDIGKLGTPDAVLKKTGVYNDNERAIMRVTALMALRFFAQGHARSCDDRSVPSRTL